MRDLTKCANCKGPIPEYFHGRGEWYITESNRVSPEAVAWMAAKAGRPSMMYVALSRSEVVSQALLDEILAAPESYAASIPDPGNASGRYSWVNTLTGGS